MRKRNREVILWLTEAEYDRLKRNAKKTGLSVQAYLRKLLTQIQPREAPPIEYFEVLNRTENRKTESRPDMASQQAEAYRPWRQRIDASIGKAGDPGDIGTDR